MRSSWSQQLVSLALYILWKRHLPTGNWRYICTEAHTNGHEICAFAGYTFNKVTFSFSLCLRCCSTNSTTLDPHLGRLFADLQKKVAKTHDVTKKLGITNSRSWFETSHAFVGGWVLKSCRLLSLVVQWDCIYANNDTVSSVYEQRDAAEYFEKILCLTSLEAAKVLVYWLFIGDCALINSDF